MIEKRQRNYLPAESDDADSQLRIILLIFVVFVVIVVFEIRKKWKKTIRTIHFLCWASDKHPWSSNIRIVIPVRAFIGPAEGLKGELENNCSCHQTVKKNGDICAGRSRYLLYCNYSL